MRCSSCGFDNPDGMKFCGECGTSLRTAGAGQRVQDSGQRVENGGRRADDGGRQRDKLGQEAGMFALAGPPSRGINSS